MSADIASASIARLQAENERLRAQLTAAQERAAMAVSYLAQAQVEIAELRHHLSPKPEVRP